MTELVAKQGPASSGWAVYKRLLGYSMRYKFMFALAAIGMITFGSADGLFMWLVKPFIDGTFVETDPFIIKMAPIAIVVLFLIRGLGGLMETYFMAWVARHVIHDMRTELCDQYLRLPQSYYDEATTGEVMSLLTFNIEQLAAAATTAVKTLIREPVKVVMFLSVMFYMAPKLAAVMLIAGPVIGGVLGTVNRHFRRYSQRIQESMGGLSHVTNEVVEGSREIRIFGAQTAERKRFSEVSGQNTRQHLKLAAVDGGSVGVMQTVAAIAVAGIVYLATQGEFAEELSAGAFIAFMGSTLALLGPVKALTKVNVVIQRGIAAADSIFEIIDREPEPDQGERSLAECQGRVAYRDVSFRYARSDKSVLSDIDLHIEAGQTVAFVGQSGSGKSTLVNLLPRFYEVSEGAVELDGIDVRELKLAELRQHISFVSQQVTLFNTTIAGNIAYGAMQGASAAEIEAAARAANAWDFISAMPEGLETPVGQDGLMLSGGQRQRIAIARALLKDAPVLILDEATSALDTESERHIQSALESLMENRTTLVIAHRLSTIENADRIVVMEQGRIVETGSHRELLEAKGHYARFHSLQFKADA